MAESSTRAKVHGDMDRLSHLPNNLVETILKHLPLRDIVRTKILSHAWRDELSVVPHLVFDEESFPHLEGEDEDDFDSRLVRIISQLLLLNHREIKTFEVSVDIECCPDIDVWIHHLSRHGVDRFTLKIREGSLYKLPSIFFLIKGVTYLKLLRCVFNPPYSFKGYSKLTTLWLDGVVFTDGVIKQLLTVCPLLKILVLMDVECDSLIINHRNLEEFAFVSKSTNLCFESAPLLYEVAIAFSSSNDIKDDCSNIVDLFGNVPRLRSLSIYNDTLEQLSVKDLPVSIPSLYPLQDLCIDINFDDDRQLLACFCIFRSSIVLKKLEVEASDNSMEGAVSMDGFWQAQDYSDIKFSQLKTVTMKFCGSTSEMKFVQFILASTPSLVRMQIEFHKNLSNREQTLVQLLRFSRSSATAEIIVA